MIEEANDNDKISYKKGIAFYFDVCFLADGAFDFEFCAIFPESARAHSAAYSFMEALAAFVSADFLELAEAFA